MMWRVEKVISTRDTRLDVFSVSACVFDSGRHLACVQSVMLNFRTVYQQAGLR